MRKLPAFAFAGIVAAALVGSAYAAAPKTHVMNVPLPGGSVARVEYVGDVAPKVMVASRPVADAGMPWAMPMPSFAGFDRMIEQMNRQTEEMIRRAQEMARQPAAGAAGAPYIASYGNLPGAGTSTTVVSVSNGQGTCTRTTQVVSQGAGRPPKVTSNVTGQCAAADEPSSGAANPA